MAREWVVKNPDAAKKASHDHYEKNRARLLEQSAARYAADPAKYRAKSQAHIHKLSKSYIAAQLGFPTKACSKISELSQLIEKKREQLILRRLAKEMKQATYNGEPHEAINQHP